MTGSAIAEAQSSAPVIAPLADQERVVSLDIIRAISFFAVLLIHAQMFSHEALLRSGRALPQGWLDRGVFDLTEILVRGKGISCFSMLFGVGFFIQFERAAAKGLPILPFAVRRLGALFLMGLLHYRFVWTGDVLSLYAIYGFALLLCLGARPRTLLVAALAVVLFAGSVPSLIHGLHMDPRWSIEAWNRPEVQALGNAPFGGTLGAGLPAKAGRFIARILYEGGSIFPLFLIGALLWRLGYLADPLRHERSLKRLFHACFWPGLLLSLLTHDPYAWVSETARRFADGTPWILAGTLGTFALALGYLSGTLRLLARPQWMRRVQALAPMGRMALTNYLSHTFLLLFFVHAGERLRILPGPASSLVVAAMIYALQLAWSHAWLKRFRFGPMEWAWRSITYGKLQPLR